MGARRDGGGGGAGAMAGVRLAADPAGGTDWAGFELCRHDNAAPALPGAPDGQASDTHCVFCISGPGFVLTPPAGSTVFSPVEISIAPWPAGGLARGAGHGRRQCAAQALGRTSRPPRRVGKIGGKPGR
jgi:hypothetical protein